VVEPVSVAAAPPPAAPPSNSSRGQKLVNVAMRYIGYPYAWGGASPGGFDCSGFTSYVAGSALGIGMGRTVDSQVGVGVAVNSKDLEPGDLVFFVNTYQAGLSHVGIYIGGGQMIHAGSERTGVTISNIWDAYWGPKFYAARRI
jgi:cell wall-associated NlpC family hydrolase